MCVWVCRSVYVAAEGHGCVDKRVLNRYRGSSTGHVFHVHAGLVTGVAAREIVNRGEARHGRPHPRDVPWRFFIFFYFLFNASCRTEELFLLRGPTRDMMAHPKPSSLDGYSTVRCPDKILATLTCSAWEWERWYHPRRQLLDSNSGVTHTSRLEADALMLYPLCHCLPPQDTHSCSNNIRPIKMIKYHVEHGCFINATQFYLNLPQFKDLSNLAK